MRLPTDRFTRVLPIALLSLTALALWSCQSDAERHLPAVEETVQRIGKRVVPDKRVDVFRVEARADGERIVLAGEVMNPNLPGELNDSLAAAFPGLAVVDSIAVLPLADLGERTHGIVNVSVANMRREPRHGAELVNQTLLGTVLTILKEDDGWMYVQNWEGYLGWVTRWSLAITDSAGAAAWKAGPQLICTANYGQVFSAAEGEREYVLTDLTPTARLKKLGEWLDYYRVAMPDGRPGYVRKTLMTDAAALARIDPVPERILATARQFLGIPYLWGGTSSKGFDCSGFTQTVYRLNNLNLPRDASQQALLGERVEAGGDDFGNVRPGDLLFFGRSPERISHVAIYLGESRFIHSSIGVEVNSFDPEHPDYSRYRHNTFQFAKRLLQ